VSRRRRVDLALLLIIRRAERDAQLSGRRGDQQPHTARAIDREDHPYSAWSEQPPPPVTE
jgi:hypothetical protein